MPGGKILVTGATGYVGGRLLRLLASEGADVRAMARHPARLEKVMGGGAEIVQADLLDRSSLDGALSGVQTAYYLVHSMGAGPQYAELDRQAAARFLQAAEAHNVHRIIYLGGLGDSSSELSPHLRSRQEVGRILRGGRVQVVELRASIVLGSGSLSFEMIRALSERLPVMVTPRWATHTAQPIAIEDLLRYLQLCREHPVDGDPIYEVGGPDRVSYVDLMREYAHQRGLKRVMLPVPVLTPRLSGLWLGLVTPLYARVGRVLIDSIRNPTVVQDHRALRDFPVRPMGAPEAIARALRNEDRAVAETHWADAHAAAGLQPNWVGARFGNRLIDHQQVTVTTPAAVTFAPIARIGGAAGWYYANGLWKLRGWLDLLLGGVGMRRGRRDPETLHPGDYLDCWRVEEIETPRLLRLRAEMKLPGRAWLQWEVVSNADGGSTVHQTALFDPLGVSGRAYWYLVYPLHKLVFVGMLRGIARRGRDASPMGSDEHT